MKRAVLVIVVGLVLQVLLCLSPYVPFVRTNIWEAQTSVNQFASTLALYLGLQLAIIAAMLSLILFDFRAQTGEILNQYAPLHVRQLKEADFYKDFFGSCVKAQHYVKICYFAPQPPDYGAPRERETYYRQLTNIIKKNPGTVFKRIIRDTPENRDWVRRLATSLVKATNYHVAMIDDGAGGAQMGQALSVQIVDGTDAWLVAVSEHTGAEMYRDLGIQNPVIAEFLDRYFDRLWELSTVVFAPGYTVERVNRALARD